MIRELGLEIISLAGREITRRHGYGRVILGATTCHCSPLVVPLRAAGGGKDMWGRAPGGARARNKMRSGLVRRDTVHGPLNKHPRHYERVSRTKIYCKSNFHYKVQYRLAIINILRLYYNLYVTRYDNYLTSHHRNLFLLNLGTLVYPHFYNSICIFRA